MNYKVTTKERIIGYLRYRGLTSGTELESQARDWGTKASVISRRAREMASDGEIERVLGYKKTVQYRMPSMSTADASRFLDTLKEVKQGALL